MAIKELHIPEGLPEPLPSEAITYIGQLGEQLLHPLPGQKFDIGVNFLGSCQLPEHDRAEKMGAVDYAESVQGQENFIAAAKRTTVVITDMDAGLGTTVSRDEYVNSIGHLASRSSTLGSKGTDIHFSIFGYDRPMSIMEVKARFYRSVADSFRQTLLEPLLNFESRGAYNHFLHLKVPSLRSRGRKSHSDYQSLLQHTSRLSLAKPLMQPHLPTFSPDAQELTSERIAPGGHGYLASVLLNKLASHPPTDASPRVRVITNGDGVNNTASAEMVGFTLEEKAGIVMLTTTRTAADVKGGIIGLRRVDGQEFVDIMEAAQAKDEQKGVFQALGVEKEISGVPGEYHPNQQYFNTNTALLNEGLLGVFLPKLKALIGDEQFARITTPDLIENPKEQGGKNYVQLEGAMGSVLLKLNQFVTTNEAARNLWASISDGNQFLRIINLDETVRDNFFTPIKTSWDAFLQTASDRFTLDTDWRLHNERPGKSIKATLEPPSYKKLDVVLSSFRNTSIIDLDALTITGQHAISLAGMKLKGKVVIHNNFANLAGLSSILHTFPVEDGKPVLENVEITIGEHGEIKVKLI